MSTNTSENMLYIKKLGSMALKHYQKATDYKNKGELEGALINYTLSVNELYTIRDIVGKNYFLSPDSDSDTSRLEPIIKLSQNIEEAIKQNIKYIVPLQKKLKDLINQRQCICEDDDDDLCVDISITKTPCLTFDDISGQKEGKNQIKKGILYPLLYPRLYPVISKGILFYGPPGTGKTLLAKAFVNELQIEANKKGKDIRILFYAPTGASLKGKYVGETEKNIAKYFNCASKQASSCEKVLVKSNSGGATEIISKVISVIFIDEVEAIAGKRGGDDPMMTNSVNTLLQMMDGVKSFDNVVVMAATNYPFNLDDAILRRFDTKVYVTLPKKDDIINLIKLELGNQIYKSLNPDKFNIPKSVMKKEIINIDPDDPLKFNIKLKKNTCNKGNCKINSSEKGRLKSFPAICCGTKGDVCLKFDCFNSVSRPKKIEIFEFYRGRYFPKLTDDELATIAATYEELFFSGGDIRNACKAVSNLLGSESKKLNIWQIRTIENPNKIMNVINYEDGSEDRQYRKYVPCLLEKGDETCSKLNPNKSINNFNHRKNCQCKPYHFLLSSYEGMSGRFKNRATEEYLVFFSNNYFNRKSTTNRFLPIKNNLDITAGDNEESKKLKNLIKLLGGNTIDNDKFEKYLFENNYLKLDSLTSGTINNNNLKLDVYISWYKIKSSSELKKFLAFGRNVLEKDSYNYQKYVAYLNSLIIELDKLFSYLKPVGECYITPISLRKLIIKRINDLTDDEEQIDIIIKMKLKSIVQARTVQFDKSLLVKVSIKAKLHGEGELWITSPAIGNFIAAPFIPVKDFFKSVGSGIYSFGKGSVNFIHNLLTGDDTDRNLELGNIKEEFDIAKGKFDTKFNSLKSPQNEFPLQVLSMANELITIDKRHRLNDINDIYEDIINQIELYKKKSSSLQEIIDYFNEKDLIANDIKEDDKFYLINGLPRCWDKSDFPWKNWLNNKLKNNFYYTTSTVKINTKYYGRFRQILDREWDSNELFKNVRYNGLKKCLVDRKIVDDTIYPKSDNEKINKLVDCGIGTDLIINLINFCKSSSYLENENRFMNLYKAKLAYNFLELDNRYPNEKVQLLNLINSNSDSITIDDISNKLPEEMKNNKKIIHILNLSPNMCSSDMFETVSGNKDDRRNNIFDMDNYFNFIDLIRIHPEWNKNDILPIVNGNISESNRRGIDADDNPTKWFMGYIPIYNSVNEIELEPEYVKNCSTGSVQLGKGLEDFYTREINTISINPNNKSKLEIGLNETDVENFKFLDLETLKKEIINNSKYADEKFKITTDLLEKIWVEKDMSKIIKTSNITNLDLKPILENNQENFSKNLKLVLEDYQKETNREFPEFINNWLNGEYNGEFLEKWINNNFNYDDREVMVDAINLREGGYTTENFFINNKNTREELELFTGMYDLSNIPNWRKKIEFVNPDSHNKIFDSADLENIIKKCNDNKELQIKYSELEEEQIVFEISLVDLLKHYKFTSPPSETITNYMNRNFNFGSDFGLVEHMYNFPKDKEGIVLGEKHQKGLIPGTVDNPKLKNQLYLRYGNDLSQLNILANSNSYDHTQRGFNLPAFRGSHKNIETLKISLEQRIVATLEYKNRVILDTAEFKEKLKNLSTYNLKIALSDSDNTIINKIKDWWRKNKIYNFFKNEDITYELKNKSYKQKSILGNWNNTDGHRGLSNDNLLGVPKNPNGREFKSGYSEENKTNKFDSNDEYFWIKPIARMVKDAIVFRKHYFDNIIKNTQFSIPNPCNTYNKLISFDNRYDNSESDIEKSNIGKRFYLFTDAWKIYEYNTEKSCTCINSPDESDIEKNINFSDLDSKFIIDKLPFLFQSDKINIKNLFNIESKNGQDNLNVTVVDNMYNMSDEQDKLVINYSEIGDSIFNIDRLKILEEKKNVFDSNNMGEYKLVYTTNEITDDSQLKLEKNTIVKLDSKNNYNKEDVSVIVDKIIYNYKGTVDKNLLMPIDHNTIFIKPDLNQGIEDLKIQYIILKLQDDEYKDLPFIGIPLHYFLTQFTYLNSDETNIPIESIDDDNRRIYNEYLIEVFKIKNAYPKNWINIIDKDYEQKQRDNAIKNIRKGKASNDVYKTENQLMKISNVIFSGWRLKSTNIPIFATRIIYKNSGLVYSGEIRGDFKPNTISNKINLEEDINSIAHWIDRRYIDILFEDDHDNSEIDNALNNAPIIKTYKGPWDDGYPGITDIKYSEKAQIEAVKNAKTIYYKYKPGRYSYTHLFSGRKEGLIGMTLNLYNKKVIQAQNEDDSQFEIRKLDLELIKYSNYLIGFSGTHKYGLLFSQGKNKCKEIYYWKSIIFKDGNYNNKKTRLLIQEKRFENWEGNFYYGLKSGMGELQLTDLKSMSFEYDVIENIDNEQLELIKKMNYYYKDLEDFYAEESVYNIDLNFINTYLNICDKHSDGEYILKNMDCSKNKNESKSIDKNNLLTCKITDLKEDIFGKNPEDRYISFSYLPGYFTTVIDRSRNDSVISTNSEVKIEVLDKYKRGESLTDKEKKLV